MEKSDKEFRTNVSKLVKWENRLSILLIFPFLVPFLPSENEEMFFQVGKEDGGEMEEERKRGREWKRERNLMKQS